MHDDPPSPRRGGYFHKLGDYFEVQRSFNLSPVSALSTGSYHTDQALAALADNQIHPHKCLQNAPSAKKLPVEDDFISDEEESKASTPKAIRSVPESGDFKLEPIAYHSKSTDVVSQILSKGPSEQEQVRARLETSPPAVQRKGSKKEKSSPVKRKGSNKVKGIPDPSTAFEVVSKNFKQKQPNQKKDPQESVEVPQSRRRHLKRSTKAVQQVDGEIISDKYSDEGLFSGSVTVDTELPHRRSRRRSHNRHSSGGEEGAHIAHHPPNLHANHHHHNKEKINRWVQSLREKMRETRQGTKNPPSCRNLVSQPIQTRSKMFFRSLSVGNMDDAADQPLLPPLSPPPTTKSTSISHLSSTEVESKSSEESTSKDNDREVIDDEEEEDNKNKNSEEMEDGKGSAKPMSVRRQLVAASPPRDFTRLHLGKSYGRSLSLPDVTSTPSFDTMSSPQRRRRGKKPGTKLIPLSPQTKPTPRSPPTRCDHRRDHHRDPKKNKDTRHRSTSCDQPPSSDLPRPRSQSTPKPIQEQFSTRSNPFELAVMESSGQDDQKLTMARSRP